MSEAVLSRPEVRGDGVFDDTAGIQALLDSRAGLVHLPPAPVFYLISRPLRIHSDQCLSLDPCTVVRLAPASDCLMITNSDHESGNRNISVRGGVWDMDNRSQSANPLAALLDCGQGFPAYHPDRYLGICMRFVGVKYLEISSLTFRDPVTFCAQLARVEYFSVREITFDFQHWNPHPVNMDGIHLDGGCRHGRIANLRGRTFDDMVALNADDMEGETPFAGPIEDIDIDGLYAEEGHSAVRLLSTGSPVRRITISRVHGSFYQYSIGFTHYFPKRADDGLFEDIVLRDIFCRKAPRLPEYQKDLCPVYPIIYFEGRARVKRLKICNLAVPAGDAVAIGIDAGAKIDALDISHVGDVGTDRLIENRGELAGCVVNGKFATGETFR